MPPKVKTEAEVAKERARILKEAADIISKNGYENLTMRKLASQCGVSATKIYYYFENKDAVYLSVMVEGFELLYTKARQAYEAGSTEEERFSNLCFAILKFAKEYMFYYEIMFNGRLPRCLDFSEDNSNPLAQKEKEVGLQFYGVWCTALKELGDVNQKELDSLDYILMFSQLHGVISLELSNLLREIEIDYDTLTHTISQKLLNQIKR